MSGPRAWHNVYSKSPIVRGVGEGKWRREGVKDPRTGFLLSFRPQLNHQHSAKPYLLPVYGPYSMTVMILGWRKFYKDVC